MKFNLVLIFVFILSTSDLFSQGYADRDTIGKQGAINFINEYIENHIIEKSKHELVKYLDKKLVTDSFTAVKIAESILFKAIGEKEIIKQRPYEVYFISDFWFIRGTIKKVKPGTMLGGGQFNIIIDSYDSRVVLLSEDE